jgi:ABC-type antimicrobial peptide transport system permease subunit
MKTVTLSFCDTATMIAFTKYEVTTILELNYIKHALTVIVSDQQIVTAVTKFQALLTDVMASDYCESIKLT